MPVVRYGSIPLRGFSGSDLASFFLATGRISNDPSLSKTAKVGRMRIDARGKALCRECVVNPMRFIYGKYYCDACARSARCESCQDSGMILGSEDNIPCGFCNLSVRDEGRRPTAFTPPTEDEKLCLICCTKTPDTKLECCGNEDCCRDCIGRSRVCPLCRADR